MSHENGHQKVKPIVFGETLATKLVDFDFEKDGAPAIKFPRRIRPIKGRPSAPENRISANRRPDEAPLFDMDALLRGSAGPASSELFTGLDGKPLPMPDEEQRGPEDPICEMSAKMSLAPEHENGPENPVKSATPANQPTVMSPVTQAASKSDTVTSSTEPTIQDATKEVTWIHVTTKEFTGMVPSWAPRPEDPDFAEFAELYLVEDYKSTRVDSAKPAAPVEQKDGDSSEKGPRDSVKKDTKQLEDCEKGYKKQLNDMEKSYKKQLDILQNTIAKNNEAHSKQLRNNAQKYKLGMADLEIQATEAQDTLTHLQKHDTEQNEYIHKQARLLRDANTVIANANASITASNKTVGERNVQLAKSKDLLRKTYRDLQESRLEAASEKVSVEKATSSLEKEKEARTTAEAEVAALREKYEELRSSDLNQLLKAANQSLEKSTAEVANLSLYRDNYKRQWRRVEVEMKKVRAENAELSAKLEDSEKEFQELREVHLRKCRLHEEELAMARTKAIDQANELPEFDGGPPSPAFGSQTQPPPPAPQASQGTQTDDLGAKQVLALSEVQEISVEPTIMAAAPERDQGKSGAGMVPGMVPIIIIFIIVMMMLMMMMGHHDPWTVCVTSWRTGMGCGRSVPEWLWEDPFLELSGSLFG